MKTVSDLFARAKRLLWPAAAALLLLVVQAPVFAQTVTLNRAFSQRYTTNATGDIKIIGNTMMTCSLAICTTSVQDGTSATNLTNNSHTMVNVDIDTVDAGLTTTGTVAPLTVTYNNSSSADFTLPAGATILKAYLTWNSEGTATANTATAIARGRIKFRTSSLGSYTTVTALNVDQIAATGAGVGYAAVADVTSLVSNVSTTFTVAGMATESGTTDTYGGWALVLVLNDPAEPFRKLTVFDGLVAVTSAASQTINLALGSNATPPTGPVSMRMGMVAGEGDRGSVGDTASMRSYASPGSSPNAYTLLPNDKGATNDFFNSSITRLNVNVAAKNPNYINNLGFDLDVFDVPNVGNAVVQNNTTALDIQLATSSDVFRPSVVTTAVQLYVPNVQNDMVKTVVDLNGGDVQPGDILEYTIAFSNTGGDFADNVVLSDPIPANTTYVAGSLSTALGPPLSDTARSDAAGDDAAAYYAAGCPSFNAAPCVRAYLGVGATAAAGGSVSPGGPAAANSQVRFKFRVQVNASIPLGTLVTNSASITYTARTLGQTFTVTSPVATATNGPANLRLTKTHVGDFQQGQSNAAYTITVINDGGITTAAFTVTDTLPTGMTFVSGAGTNWTCSAIGQVVTCQNSNAAPLALSGTSAITLLVNVSPTASSPLVNTVTASGGGELAGTTGNNTATDSTTIAGAPNLTITKAHTGNFNVSQTGRTYTVTVTNSGTSPTTGTVSVVDTPPAGMTVTAIAGTGWACTLATRTCTRVDALGSGSSYPVITVTATMPATSGTYDQVATVSGGGELFTTDNTATDPTLVLAATLDFQVTKTHTGNFYQGQVGATYDIVVTNSSGVNSGGSAQFTVVDTPPAGMTITAMSGTGWTCTVGTATCTRTSVSSLNGGLSHPPITVTVTVATNAASPLVNSVTSTPSGVSGDSNAANNTATDSTIIEPRIDLALTKIASTATPTQGVPFSYTVTVSNTSINSATGVSVLDVLPSGLTFVSATPSQGAYNSGNGAWTVGAVAAGGNATLTLNVTPTVTGAIVNTAQVLAADQIDVDSTPNNSVAAEDDQASVAVTVLPSAQLVVTKTTSTASVVNTGAGATATYTVTVNNPSTVAALGVKLIDTLPAGFTYASTTSVTLNGSTLAASAYQAITTGAQTPATPQWDSNPSLGFTVNAGQSLVVVFNAALAASVADATYNNSAAVTSTSLGVGITNFDGTASTTDNVVVTSAVLATTKTTSTPAVSLGTSGGSATYTVTVANTGAGPATAVKVVDTLPAGFTYGSTTSVTLNGAALTAAQFQAITTGAQTTATPQWDSNPSAGFTINAGQSLVIVFNAAIASGTADGTYDNSATTTGAARSIASFDGAVNTTDNVTISGAILTTTKTTSTPTLSLASTGGTATYTVTLANSGSAPATGVKVVDVLPAGFTYGSTTSVTLNGGALAASGYQVVTTGAQTTATPQWDTTPTGGFTINAGQSLVIVFNASVAGGTADGTYNNSVNSTSGPVRSLANFNGAASTTDDVTISSAVLTTNKTTSTPAIVNNGAGSIATYTITVTNTGSGPAAGVKVEDSPLPLGFTYASTTSVTLNGSALAASAYQAVTTGAFTVANPQWDTNPGGGFTINAGQSLVIVFNATVNTSVGDGTYSNNATTTGAARSIANFNGALNTSDDVAITSAVLTVTKTTSTPSVLLAGGPGLATYTVTVSNSGGGAATGVKLTDSLPAGFTYAATNSVTLNGSATTAYAVTGATSPQWDTAPTGGFTINAGQSLVVVFDATIAATTVGGVYSNSASATGAARSITNFNGAASTLDDVLVIAGVDVSGTVYADANHNTQRDAGEVGVGVTLYAKLVPAATPAGPATKFASVNASSGAYTFTGVSAGEYLIVLDDNSTLTDVTPTPPAGWLGTQMPTGIRSNVVVTNVDQANQDFGLYRGSRVSGRVFEDNGIGAGVPNNGVQDGGEVGLANVTVRASTGDTTVTDGGGNYTLWIPVAGPSIAASVIETNLSNHVSVGGTAGATGGAYVRATDTVSFTAVGGNIYTGVNFADVRDNALANNGQQTTAPGNVVFYAHTFTPGTGGTVSFSIASVTNPGTVTGFTQSLFQDSNCNGVLDIGEPVLSSAVTVQATVPLCVIVKETVPGGAPSNATDIATLSAVFTYTNAAPGLSASYSNVDTTTVGAAGALNLMKSQSTATALPGANIVYTIDYTNTSANALSNIVLRDATPTYTRFVSAACVGPLPAGITGCSVTTQPGAGSTGTIAWTLVGSLASAARGQITFTVQVDP
jgi:uncharacterized repeat protein (TIGR01451 family)/fimbrial isopeptide formation D2 family protein